MHILTAAAALFVAALGVSLIIMAVITVTAVVAIGVFRWSNEATHALIPVMVLPSAVASGAVFGGLAGRLIEQPLLLATLGGCYGIWAYHQTMKGRLPGKPMNPLNR